MALLINYDCFSIITKSGVLRKGAEHQFRKKYAEEVASGKFSVFGKIAKNAWAYFFNPFYDK